MPRDKLRDFRAPGGSRYDLPYLYAQEQDVTEFLTTSALASIMVERRRAA